MPNRTFQELREVFDGSDSFMNRGHGVRTPNSRKKKIPMWALNDSKVKTLLLRAFPKLQTNDRQRKLAARWLRIIHLYYRAGWTKGQVAQELGEKPSIIKDVLTHIRRVQIGVSANGTGVLGRKRGRPKIVHPSPPLREAETSL